ncbi:hypothetical protein CFP56_009121 [Quercus suber]|uniref:Uncharacterized protein n=1 Tax=Quercus suber TaxID=58331 RepID=A0AAW0IC55_QUESU
MGNDKSQGLAQFSLNGKKQEKNVVSSPTKQKPSVPTQEVSHHQCNHKNKSKKTSNPPMISEDSLATAQKPHTSGGDTAVKLVNSPQNFRTRRAGGAPDGFGSYADNDDDGAGISCREEKEVAHGIGEMQ